MQSLCILYKKYQYVDHTNFIYFTDILEVINRNILLLHDTFNFCKILCSIVFEHFFLKCYVDHSHRRKFSISSHFDYSTKFSNMWLNDDHRAGQRVKAFWSKIDWFKRYFDFNSAKLCIWELRKKYAVLRLGFACLSHGKFDEIKIEIFLKTNYF